MVTLYTTLMLRNNMHLLRSSDRSRYSIIFISCLWTSWLFVSEHYALIICHTPSERISFIKVLYLLAYKTHLTVKHTKV